VGEHEFITFTSEPIRQRAERRHGKHALDWDKAQRSVTAGRNNFLQLSNVHLGMSQRLAVNWPIIVLSVRFEANATPSEHRNINRHHVLRYEMVTTVLAHSPFKTKG
jgi:hypothetical protein